MARLGGDSDRSGSEIALVARHVSRHLVDRENTPAISWNLAGVRASHRVAVGRTMIDGRLDFGHAMQTWFVDYTWMTELRLTASRPIDSRLDFVSEATGVLVNVDHQERARRACGRRIEVALRLKGAAAAVTWWRATSAASMAFRPTVFVSAPSRWDSAS